MGLLSNFLFNRTIESKYQEFHTLHYLDITARRLEHLATLGLEIQDKSVLELGAGVGDLTQFFVARDCEITATDARPDLVDTLRERFSNQVNTLLVDLEDPSLEFKNYFDIVFCYGILYHLSNPEAVIKTLASVVQHEIGYFSKMTATCSGTGTRYGTVVTPPAGTILLVPGTRYH